MMPSAPRSPAAADGTASSDSRIPALSVVIPAFDEEENIGPVVGELRATLPDVAARWELVLVDDGSRDGTRAAMHALAGEDPERSRVVGRDHNGGMGAALRDGYAAARLEWLTFLPADGQIDPADLAAFAAPVAGGADLVTSVYRTRDDGLVRATLSRGLRVLTAVIGGSRVRLEGVYVVRRGVYQACRPEADTLFFNLELPLRAARAGARIETVTISCRPRRSGESKVAGTPLVAAKRMARVFRELVALRVRMAAAPPRRLDGR
ncbi:MAG TPA: glycosyltransferase family 2 protein [Myxococcota bacterium]|jgi:glycosyltransferase involved in cell wall biosynthesis|nr:glycosyltransferase family 2 protein [Myxococcota bacterium]